MRTDPPAITFSTAVVERLTRCVIERLPGTEGAELGPLFAVAVESAAKAYARYSGFHVGVAVEIEGGTVFRGCNVENVSYPVGVCAERNALGAAVVGRSGPAQPVRLALVAFADEGGEVGQKACSPCGACRQAIWELNPECLVHFFVGSPLTLRNESARALLPHAFTL